MKILYGFFLIFFMGKASAVHSNIEGNIELSIHLNSKNHQIEVVLENKNDTPVLIQNSFGISDEYLVLVPGQNKIFEVKNSSYKYPQGLYAQFASATMGIESKSETFPDGYVTNRILREGLQNHR